MAFVANYNPLDDETETTGSTTGQNQNTPTIIAPAANAEANDSNVMLNQPDNQADTSPTFSAPSDSGASDQIYATSFGQPIEFSPDVNATKGSGFTNLQRYLSANQGGGTALGQQVANKITGQVDQAQTAAGSVEDFAQFNPMSGVFGTQENQTAQRAFNTAQDTAKLAGTAGGQSQLLKTIQPGVSSGGTGLNQFLMNQSGGQGLVRNAAATVSPLQKQYQERVGSLENNSIINNILGNQGIQTQFGQNPNTTQNWTGGATGTMPSTTTDQAGADQAAYLRQLQSGFLANPGNVANVGIQQSINDAKVAAAIKNAIPKAPYQKLVLTPAEEAAAAGYKQGMDNELQAGRPYGGASSGGSGGREPTTPSIQSLGYTIDETGTAIPDAPSLSKTAASAIGTVLSKITGIPFLSLALSQINAYAAAQNQAAANEWNNRNVGVTTGGAMDVGGDAPTAGEAEATANVGNVPVSTPQPTTPAQTAAAIAEGSNLTPGEAANERIAAEQAAAQTAAAQTAAAQTAAAQEAAQSQRTRDAAQEAAARQAAQDAAYSQAAQDQRAAEAAAQKSSRDTFSSTPPSGNESMSVRDQYASYGAGKETAAADTSTVTGGGGGGGSSSSSRVICTHFYRKGEMDRDTWRADIEYTHKNLSPTTVRGYQYWAIPYVKLMRRNKLAEDIMRPLAMHRAKELAYQLGKTKKGSIFGKCIRLVLEPVCFTIGLFVGEQDWKSLWLVKE